MCEDSSADIPSQVQQHPEHQRGRRDVRGREQPDEDDEDAVDVCHGGVGIGPV